MAILVYRSVLLYISYITTVHQTNMQITMTFTFHSPCHLLCILTTIQQAQQAFVVLNGTLPSYNTNSPCTSTAF